MIKAETISAQKKAEYVKRYLNGYESQATLAKEIGVSKSSFQKWIVKYKIGGEKELHRRNKNKRYSTSIKKEAVEDYLSKKYTEVAVCQKYEIRSRSQLEQWILWYNENKFIKHKKSNTRSYKKMSSQKEKTHIKHKEKTMITDEYTVRKLKKLEIENAKLKQKNADLEMELALRKKVKELKGGVH